MTTEMRHLFCPMGLGCAHLMHLVFAATDMIYVSFCKQRWMNPWNSCNVAAVVSRTTRRREWPSSHRGRQPPICFQLRWLRGYFIIVSMIYSQSVWFHFWRHTCNAKVGGQWVQRRAHACLHTIKLHAWASEFPADLSVFHRDTVQYERHTIIS